jgi:hypothetical protein
MKESWNRRRVLKQLGAASAAAVLPRSAVAKIFLQEPTPDREIQITSAIASHPGQPRRNSRQGQNIPREKV